jgi:hypothetical protein
MDACMHGWLHRYFHMSLAYEPTCIRAARSAGSLSITPLLPSNLSALTFAAFPRFFFFGVGF